MAVSFSLAATTPPGGRAHGQLIIPPPLNRERQNSPSNSNLAAINAAAATMRMRHGRNGLLRPFGTPADDTDDEPVLTAMTALFESLHEVHLEGGSDPWKPCIKTADGFRACKQFLYALCAAADALKIRPQSREYRNQFTKNYRALFPDQKRHYRVDVLEASQEGYTMIYVNGEKFDFHGSVVESGVNFKLAWITAMDKLLQLQRQNLSTNLYWRSELVPILVDLDSKWADFEQEYILELIQIERKARRYVMDVIYLENQLIYLDSSVTTLVAKGDASETAHLHIWQQWQSCRRDYVRKVFRLNAIANYRRRGRGDLDLSVLETAENIIKTSESHPGHVYEAVSSIAASCVTSFNDFRKHINELAQTPERIDPHLCNNVTLVNHLVRVEETWELAQKYLMDTQRLRNIINIVDFILSVVRTQKAIIAILGSAEASSSSSRSSSGNSGKGFEGAKARLASPGAAVMMQLESEKERSLGDIFSVSAVSSSSSSASFSSSPSFSFSSSAAFSSCSSSKDLGLFERQQQQRQNQEHEDAEEEEEVRRGGLAATHTGRMQLAGDFVLHKKENAVEAAANAAAAAGVDSSTSRIDTLSCTTRGSLMRQRTSSNNSADRRETLEEKLIACDVEAFLALPRFVCLYYLLDPIHRSHILRQFLPHYFVEGQGFSDACVEAAEEAYGKNTQQQVCLFPTSLRKSFGATTAGGGAAPAIGCAVSSGSSSSSRSSCSSSVDQMEKGGASLSTGESAAARASGARSAGGGSSEGFHCSDFSAEETIQQDGGGRNMDVQQQLQEEEEEVKEVDCRLLSTSASDATTRPPSRLSSHLGDAVSRAAIAAATASHSSSSSCTSAAAAASAAAASAAAAAAASAAAAACTTRHPFNVAPASQSACNRTKLLTLRSETDSEGSTLCGFSLRESTDSGIAASSSSSSSTSGVDAFYASSSSSPGSGAAAAATSAVTATNGAAAAVATAASSSAFSAAAMSGNQRQQHQQKGLRAYMCSDEVNDQYYNCSKSGSTSSAGEAAAATAAASDECNSSSNDWFVQQQKHSSRLVLSKVPAGLRKMVKAWMRIQSWLKAEGLQDSKEAWLCIIARLADSEDFKLLLQKWAETKLAGFRHHLESLFQSVEEISMALQRSSPQDWNEFLQAIIQGIQRDSPSRRSLL